MSILGGFFLFYRGIDIAKRNHQASVIDAERKSLPDSITITNTQDGREKLFALFERLRSPNRMLLSVWKPPATTGCQFMNA